MGLLDEYAADVLYPVLRKKVDFDLRNFLTDAGALCDQNGKRFYNQLSPADQQRVDKAIASRIANLPPRAPPATTPSWACSMTMQPVPLSRHC